MTAFANDRQQRGRIAELEAENTDLRDEVEKYKNLYTDENLKNHGVRSALSAAKRARDEAVARLAASELYAERLRTALEDARNNGLIYWEPNTERGHVSKAAMLDRIDQALSAPRPEPSAVAVVKVAPTNTCSEC